MKWFDQWFYRQAKKAWDNKDRYEEEHYVNKIQGTGKLTSALSVEESSSWGDGLRINVKRVIGGHIVSFRTYDHRKDRSEERHYIITDEQDFNKELGNMITLESLRQYT